MLIYTFTFDGRLAHVLAQSEEMARAGLAERTANHDRAVLMSTCEPMLPIVLYSDLLPF